MQTSCFAGTGLSLTLSQHRFSPLSVPLATILPADPPPQLDPRADCHGKFYLCPRWALLGLVSGLHSAPRD